MKFEKGKVLVQNGTKNFSEQTEKHCVFEAACL